MATIKVETSGDFIDQMTAILSGTSSTVGKMIYSGAGVVADEIRRRIQQIPEREIYETGGGKHHQRGITDVERQGLLDSLGISKARNDGGYYNVRIGFEGYNDYVTDSYPKGHPNSMVARTIESGTSFLASTPFIAPAVSATRNKAERVMETIYDNGIR